MPGFLSTLATIWRLAIPYFRSEDRVAGRILLAAVVAIELSLVGINVLLNQWNARFYNALQERAWDAFVQRAVDLLRCSPASSSCSRSTSSISISGSRSAGGAG